MEKKKTVKNFSSRHLSIPLYPPFQRGLSLPPLKKGGWGDLNVLQKRGNWAVLGLCLWLSLGAISCAGSPSPPAPVDRIAQENPQGQQLEVSAQVAISGETIDLEVARTPEQQALGLMYRPQLPDNRGMLFPFSSPRILTFWMKNVPVPLDMIFLLDGEVKAIAASVPPCTTPSCPVYGPNEPVNQVIELRSGRAEELGLQVGDRLEIEFLDSP